MTDENYFFSFNNIILNTKIAKKVGKDKKEKYEEKEIRRD